MRRYASFAVSSISRRLPRRVRHGYPAERDRSAIPRGKRQFPQRRRRNAAGPRIWVEARYPVRIFI